MQNQSTIVLIGFMGVGKTTVGQVLARKTGRPFTDTDDRIVDAFSGMTIPEIFRIYGEAAFREKEQEVIAALVREKGGVLSLGGGAFKQTKIRNLCLREATVVYLDMTYDKWKERLADLMDSRPLLQGKSDEEIEALFYERRSLYQDHHIHVRTDDLSPEEVAEAILNDIR